MQVFKRPIVPPAMRSRALVRKRAAMRPRTMTGRSTLRLPTMRHPGLRRPATRTMNGPQTRTPGRLTLTADDDDIPTDPCLGPELHIPEYGNNVSIHLAIDVDASHHRNDGIANFPGYVRMPENGHDRVVDIPCTYCRPKNCDDGLSVLTCQQLSFVANRDNGVLAPVVMSVTVAVRSNRPGVRL